jgi:hypothetical protein
VDPGIYRSLSVPQANKKKSRTSYGASNVFTIHYKKASPPPVPAGFFCRHKQKFPSIFFQEMGFAGAIKGGGLLYNVV